MLGNQKWFLCSIAVKTHILEPLFFRMYIDNLPVQYDARNEKKHTHFVLQ